MNDAIRISSPADILGFIPHTLGFVPLESFVFLTMRGNTLGATLRVDAPIVADPAGFARSMVEYIELDTQATSVLLAVYTDSTPAAGTQRPFHDHVEAVIQALETAGTPLKDAWLVSSNHWQNLLCDSETGCCLPEPLETITDGHFLLHVAVFAELFRQQQLQPAFCFPRPTRFTTRGQLPSLRCGRQWRG
jgi:hypothetical protein